MTGTKIAAGVASLGDFGLDGKVAIVTGGASGLGREVVDVLSSRGAAVVVFDCDGSRAAQVAECYASEGRAVMPFCADVADASSFDEAIDLCRSNFGRFDILHNNAGIELEKPLHHTTDAEFDALMNVNLRGVFYGSRAAVNAFRNSGGGAIVSTTSVAAHSGINSVAAYCTSKAAVVAMTQCIADGYAAENIRANCVSPGEMETPMLQKFLDSMPDPHLARRELELHYPARRFAEPREVAQAVAFLASDQASFINGASLVVDGGLLARCY